MWRMMIAIALLTTPAVASEFVGPRLEGVIGWDEQRYGESYGLGDDNRSSSLGYGFALGYDAAFGNGLIAGIEGGVLFAGRGLRFGTAEDGGRFRPRRDLELSARVGTTVADRAFLYGKIGYTNFELRQELVADDIVANDKVRLDGLRLGAGLEVPITANTYLKAEYRYSDYERDVKKNDILTGFGLRF